MKRTILIISLLYACISQAQPFYPIVGDYENEDEIGGELMYINSIDNKKIPTGYDAVFDYSFFEIEGYTYLDMVWPDWAYPIRDTVTVGEISYFLWLLPVDTTYSIITLAEVPSNQKVLLSEAEYAPSYMTGGLVYMYDPISSGISYRVEDKTVLFPLRGESINASQVNLLANTLEFKYAVPANDGTFFGVPFQADDWLANFYNQDLEIVASGYNKYGRSGNGLVPVSPSGSDRFTYIDKKGEKAFNGAFNRAGNFASGRAFVKEGNSVYYIDTNGRKVIDDIFDGTDFDETGIAAVKKVDGWMIIDVEGKAIVDRYFPQVQNPSEGVLPIFYQGGWQFISKEGKPITKEKYLYVTPYKNGFAKVWKKEYGYKYPKLLLIDKTGEEVKTLIDYDQYRNIYARFDNKARK